MKVSYHLMIEEEDKKKLKHMAVDEGISLHELIIRGIKKQYNLDDPKRRTSVRKKVKVKRSLSR